MIALVSAPDGPPQHGFRTHCRQVAICSLILRKNENVPSLLSRTKSDVTSMRARACRTPGRHDGDLDSTRYRFREPPLMSRRLRHRPPEPPAGVPPRCMIHVSGSRDWLLHRNSSNRHGGRRCAAGKGHSAEQHLDRSNRGNPHSQAMARRASSRVELAGGVAGVPLTFAAFQD